VSATCTSPKNRKRQVTLLNYLEEKSLLSSLLYSNALDLEMALITKLYCSPLTPYLTGVRFFSLEKLQEHLDHFFSFRMTIGLLLRQ
jgi:hypothetical protein